MDTDIFHDKLNSGEVTCLMQNKKKKKARLFRSGRKGSSLTSKRVFAHTMNTIHPTTLHHYM